MALGLRFDFGGRFAESVAVGGIFGDAFAQVVEQDAQLAEVIGIDDQQMDARPIEIGLRAAARRR